jgi:hypothetical protein
MSRSNDLQLVLNREVSANPVFADADVYSFMLKCSTLVLYYKGIEFAYFPTDAAFTGKVKYVSG